MLILAQAVLGADDTARTPTRIQSMKYPRLGLLAQIRGTVRLRVIVDNAGAVSRADIISGHPILASASQENAQRWKFSIADAPDGTVDSFELVYEFKLEGTTETCAQTDFVFELPNKIIVVAPALHWMP